MGLFTVADKETAKKLKKSNVFLKKIFRDMQGERKLERQI